MGNYQLSHDICFYYFILQNHFHFFGPYAQYTSFFLQYLSIFAFLRSFTPYYFFSVSSYFYSSIHSFQFILNILVYTSLLTHFTQASHFHLLKKTHLIHQSAYKTILLLYFKVCLSAMLKIMVPYPLHIGNSLKQNSGWEAITSDFSLWKRLENKNEKIPKFANSNFLAHQPAFDIPPLPWYNKS